MENYVKRCVGLPGETIEVIDGDLHIDGMPADNPPGLQKEYRVVFGSQAEAKSAVRKLGLTKLDMEGPTPCPMAWRSSWRSRNLKRTRWANWPVPSSP